MVSTPPLSLSSSAVLVLLVNWIFALISKRWLSLSLFFPNSFFKISSGIGWHLTGGNVFFFFGAMLAPPYGKKRSCAQHVFVGRCLLSPLLATRWGAWGPSFIRSLRAIFRDKWHYGVFLEKMRPIYGRLWTREIGKSACDSPRNRHQFRLYSHGAIWRLYWTFFCTKSYIVTLDRTVRIPLSVP